MKKRLKSATYRVEALPVSGSTFFQVEEKTQKSSMANLDLAMSSSNTESNLKSYV
jgi:hypothetical protein